MKAFITIDSNNIIQTMMVGHQGAMAIQQDHIEITIEQSATVTLGTSKYINGQVV